MIILIFEFSFKLKLIFAIFLKRVMSIKKGVDFVLVGLEGEIDFLLLIFRRAFQSIKK